MQIFDAVVSKAQDVDRSLWYRFAFPVGGL